MEEITIQKDLLAAFCIAVIVHGIVAAADISTVRPVMHLKEGTKQFLDVSFVSTVPPEETKMSVTPAVAPRKNRVVVKKTKPPEKKPVIDKKQVEKKMVVREDTVTEVREVVTAPSVEHPDIVSEPAKPSIISAVPRYEENSPPPYPRIARRRGYEGVVMLSVEVRADGTVGAVAVKESSGHAILDTTALKTVKGWTFRPGVRLGVPIIMIVDVPVRFRLKESESS